MRALSLGLAAAMLMADVGAQMAKPSRPTKRKSIFAPRYIPNDHGPVIDTTPESKRARRRRLARAKS